MITNSDITENKKQSNTENRTYRHNLTRILTPKIKKKTLALAFAYTGISGNTNQQQ